LAAENRLSAEQLAALVPGDVVMVETSGDLRRPKLCAGTVVRIEGSCLVVSTKGARGAAYIHRFGRRSGASIGGGRHSELVTGEPLEAGPSDARRHQLRIDAAYRAWARNRVDVAKLRDLQAAISEALDGSLV